jgi:hypothetical protein
MSNAKCCDACSRGCLDTASAQQAGPCYDANCACHTIPPPPLPAVGEREDGRINEILWALHDTPDDAPLLIGNSGGSLCTASELRVALMNVRSFPPAPVREGTTEGRS